MSEELSQPERHRREKRAALEALGVRPFAWRFERSHTTADALALYRDEMGEAGPAVAIAGRIQAWRPKGKVCFGHVEDAAGRLQKHRLAFFPLGPDQVRQLGEHSDDGGATWVVDYDLDYRRVK